MINITSVGDGLAPKKKQNCGDSANKESSASTTGKFFLFAHAQSPAQIMSFAGLTVFFLSIGSTAIYTYTPELHPTEIRTTAMGIASAWGRVGAVTMLLVFGHYFASLGKSLVFLVIDSVHWCRHFGSLLWPINSRKDIVRDIGQPLSELRAIRKLYRARIMAETDGLLRLCCLN